jgi:hypothetical protein
MEFEILRGRMINFKMDLLVTKWHERDVRASKWKKSVLRFFDNIQILLSIMKGCSKLFFGL